MNQYRHEKDSRPPPPIACYMRWAGSDARLQPQRFEKTSMRQRRTLPINFQSSAAYRRPFEGLDMNHEDSVKGSLRPALIHEKELQSLLEAEKSGALLKMRPKTLISRSDPSDLIEGRGHTKPDFEPFVQCRDAAKFLGLHCKTVERYARQGLLPAHPATGRHRRRWRFLISELDVWLRSKVISACHPCSPEK
jgi:hypothetical protein